MSWRPSASMRALRLRAKLLREIRAFFAARDVLEVETSLLGLASIPDPNIHSMSVSFQPTLADELQTLYLQTSPEFAMKRLLAAGSGCIFQICKAFRNGEVGQKHNPEFSMLEWYRLGFGYKDLMAEVDALVQQLLGTEPAEAMSYQQACLQYLQLDPLLATENALRACAKQHGIEIAAELSLDDWLNLLFSYVVEPQIGQQRPMFIYDFPASQAALAQLSAADARVAERFELYYKGYELANGFGELTDAKQQRERFEQDLQKRKTQDLPSVPMDECFLAALQHGLPACAGVAMGVDRLLMLLLETDSIRDVLAFTDLHTPMTKNN